MARTCWRRAWRSRQFPNAWDTLQSASEPTCPRTLFAGATTKPRNAGRTFSNETLASKGNRIKSFKPGWIGLCFQGLLRSVHVRIAVTGVSRD